MANTLTYSNRTTPYPATIPEGRVESRSLPSTRNHNRELFRVRAHWLVDWLPDELVIQEKTVSIIRNEFLVSYVETLPIRDIGRVVYVRTPIFGGLRIIGKNTQHELHIKGLAHSKAMHAKEIIEGLLLEDSGVVDVPHWVEIDKRRDMLAEAGRDPDNQADLHHRAYPSHH